jgi:hypothetical protein
VSATLWVALALLAIGLRRLGLGYRPTPFRMLFRHDAAFVESASDAMFPPGGEIPESGVEAGIPAHVDRYLEALPARQRLLIHALFLLTEQVTLLFPAPGWGGWRRFSSLTAEQRVAALEGWRSSRFFPRRLVFLALRSILTMGYFSCPSVLRAMELAPLEIETPVVEADLLYPRAGRPKSEIAFGPKDVRDLLEEPLSPDAPLHPEYRG